MTEHTFKIGDTVLSSDIIKFVVAGFTKDRAHIPDGWPIDQWGCSYNPKFCEPYVEKPLETNHEDAYLLAAMQREESNLARAYLDLVDLLVCVTHHDGAVNDYKSRWDSIVTAELSRRER